MAAEPAQPDHEGMRGKQPFLDRPTEGPQVPPVPGRNRSTTMVADYVPVDRLRAHPPPKAGGKR